MKPDFQHVSDSIKRLNPHLFPLGAVGASKHRQPAGALDQGAEAKQRSKDRIPTGAEITVTLAAHLRRRMDPDNLGTAMKPLQDAIADWFGLDDGDPRFRWEYGQVETRAAQGVAVRIELLN